MNDPMGNLCVQVNPMIEITYLNMVWNGIRKVRKRPAVVGTRERWMCSREVGFAVENKSLGNTRCSFQHSCVEILLNKNYDTFLYKCEDRSWCAVTASRYCRNSSWHLSQNISHCTSYQSVTRLQRFACIHQKGFLFIHKRKKCTFYFFF